MLINKSKANIYISIHLNSTVDSSWRGIQIFYTTKNKENELIAKYINEFLKKRISTVRDIKKDNGYYMYKQIKIPGILIEAGFMSNPSDLYLLKQDSYQNRLALIISEGIIGYLKKI